MLVSFYLFKFFVLIVYFITKYLYNMENTDKTVEITVKNTMATPYSSRKKTKLLLKIFLDD